MRRVSWKYFDFWLFGVVILLSIFGIAMVRSAAAGNEEILNGVARQPIFLALAIFVIIGAAMVDYHYWTSIERPLYFFTIGLMVVVFVIGAVSFGAKRWIDTGLVYIQPAELAKIVMILTLADLFARSKDQPRNLRWVARSAMPTGFMVLWVYLQPNLSTTIVILVIWFSMLWITGLPIKYMVLFVLLAVVLFSVAFPFLADYQQARVINFLFPDPNASYGNTYNVDQAMITIGSGDWFGMGYGHGTQVQLRFLKVRHTDFIFAAMAEEFGFVGTTIALLLIIFVIIRCFRAARMAADPYGSLIAYGFGVLIAFQTAVNVGVNLNVIPVTGLTLPFISYGGSSLLSLGLGIGLVESIIIRHNPLEF